MKENKKSTAKKTSSITPSKISGQGKTEVQSDAHFAKMQQHETGNPQKDAAIIEAPKTNGSTKINEPIVKKNSLEKESDNIDRFDITREHKIGDPLKTENKTNNPFENTVPSESKSITNTDDIIKASENGNSGTTNTTHVQEIGDAETNQKKSTQINKESNEALS